MQLSQTALAAALLASGVAAFSRSAPAAAFVSTQSAVSRSVASVTHSAGCPCTACRPHGAFCVCSSCVGTALFSTVEAAEADVPPEVEAMDGIDSPDEAHNADRPARKSLKKKGPKGKPLDEFSVGQTVSAKVKTLASYGAFLDIGAETDGLLHISQLSVGFVSDVKEILSEGQEVEVRITGINKDKGQINLSLLSETQEAEAKEAAAAPRQRRERPQRQDNRRDDSAVVKSLASKGWDSEKFVEGTVVSTVDFGAFVRLDVSQLNEECEGEMDGLVHISAMAAGRVGKVSDVVSVDDKVQVRVKAIADRKVSLTMVSAEDEAAVAEARGQTQEPVGSTEWKKDLEKMQADMPVFKNGPAVVDARK